MGRTDECHPAAIPPPEVDIDTSPPVDAHAKHSSESAAARRAVVLVVAALIGLHIALAWSARAPGVLTGQDDAEYISLSRSIRQGGYNDLFRIDRPVHTVYPPAYPALLAAWGSIFGDSFDRLVALNVLLSAASLVVLFLAVRRAFDDRIAVLATALVAVNPVLIQFAGEICSEPAYIFFSLLALLLLRPGRVRAGRPVGGAGMAVIATATRAVGATLLLAVGANWIVEKRWRLVGAITGFAAAAGGGWLIWSSRSQDQFLGVSYLAEMRALWRGSSVAPPLFPRIARSAWYYATEGIPWQLGVPSVAGTIVDNAAGSIVIWLAAAAGVVAMLRRWRPAALYLFVYGVLLLVWLFTVDRFTLPVVPLLFVCVVVGFQSVGRRWSRRVGDVAAAGAALVLILGAVPRAAALVARNSRCHVGGPWPAQQCLTEAQASYFEAVRWIDANLPADAVLLTSKPGALWLYTGRRSVSYDAAIRLDSAAFLPWLRRNGAGWILLNRLHNREPTYLVPLMRANCRSLIVTAVFPPGSTLYAIGAGGVADDSACTSLERYSGDLRGLEFEGRIR